MNYVTIPLAALLLLFGACNSATASASERPVYNYVSGYYQLLDFDETETGIDAEPDGFGLEFSKQLNDFMYVIASYDDISGDYEIGNFVFSGDTSVLMAGVGFKHSTSRVSDVFFEPSIVYVDDNFNGDSEDDTGFAARIGFTHVFNTAFHLKGFLRHVSVMDAHTNSYGAEGRILFSDSVHGILAAEANSDGKLFKAGVSFRF
ncbi:outer membrane beta-barrel protein [Pseudidiomarina terrestris]|uniref:Outer membrane protein beta-barrel domain-containing protein n=1 Tax=Pseudidiomarina terrestris TaxID=2820060 RepID=A0AAW7QYP1_9GAMM|nr:MULTISPECIES: outer membrane beta-barrel protein [unclassified Pseudidiomarina]MDN7125306.1 hypothetical protein [Pseudidiomarina sp. 1APP75-32.1]MDN7130065.1 hypothetical protein [Pseudidiomarina sp. 1APR75-15]MDN7135570.1 hypothetical protein [Pseudidiomarina sp. 1ASP75-5]